MKKLYIILLFLGICITANAGFGGVITPEDLAAYSRRVNLKYTGSGYGYKFENGRNNKNEQAYIHESGAMGEIVYGEDNEVFIMNPVFTYFPDTAAYQVHSGNISYIKGILDGNEIVVTLPQKIFAGKPDLDSDNIVSEYLCVANFDLVDCQFNTEFIFGMSCRVNEHTTRFRIRNGNLTWLEDKDADIPFLSICEIPENYTSRWIDWNYFGIDDFKTSSFMTNQRYFESEDFEKYSLITGDANNLHNGNKEREIDVCFTDDNRLFIRNLTDYADGDIVGDIVDDTVVFPKQYLGKRPELTSYIYFTPVEFKKVDGRSIPEIQDNIVFELDTVRKRLYTDHSFYINTRDDVARPLEFYRNAYIRPFKDGFGTFVPENPEITMYFEAYPVNGIIENSDLLKFNIPDYSTEDDALNADNLYYRIYVEGELYEFTPDEYSSLTEATTDIPYNYDDGVDFTADGSQHTLSIRARNLLSLGVQSVYKDGEDEYVSEIVYVRGLTGIDGVSEASVISATYYDLNGRRVENPERGIYILRKVLSDGRLRTTKVVM